MKNKWKQLIIKTKYEDWSKVEIILAENEIYSYELIDPRMENLDNTEGRWDFIDEDIFKDEFEGITVKIYAQASDDVDFSKIISELEEKKLASIEIKEIDDQDWKNNWKSFFLCQEIGEKLVIKPSWEEYDNVEYRHIIELDPGMAFGTGGHETTRMCLLHLEKYLKEDDMVIDIGCGSGILSIAAKKLGASKVVGADLDESIVETSSENAKRNNVEVDFVVSDLFSEIDITGDLVIANIVAEIVVLVIEQLRDHLVPNGTFICSGIISSKSYLVEDALRANNFEILEKMTENDWVSIVARDINA